MLQKMGLDPKSVEPSAIRADYETMLTRKTILEKTYKSAEKEAQNMQHKLNNVEQYLGKDISKEQAAEHTPRHVGI